MSHLSSLQNTAATSVAAPTRKKNTGSRIMGSHIYDSMNDKTCHQCRQKRMDYVASSMMLKKGDKLCTIKFCHKCLFDRYGEKVEEVDASGSWICPKCHGICSCSFCMKRKGLQPTDILVRTAKVIWCSSVLELLDCRGSEGSNSDKALVHDKGVVPYKRQLVSEKIHVEVDDSNCQTPTDGGEEGKKLMKLLKKLKKENESGEDFENRNEHEKVLKLKDTELLAIESQQYRENLQERTNTEALPRVLKLRKHGMKSLNKPDQENIVLPQGTPLVEVAGIAFSIEDVGLALQFMEFCKAFSKVLPIKRGHLEAVLEVAGKCPLLQPSLSSIMQFHIRLLSLIRKDRRESVPVSYSIRSATSWLEALGKCISESVCPLKELLLEFSNNDSTKYNNLDPTTKLRLLNFLCDETLTTGDVRSWIEQEDTKFYERKKEMKEKRVVAKRKVKDLKQKLKVELAKPCFIFMKEPLF